MSESPRAGPDSGARQIGSPISDFLLNGYGQRMVMLQPVSVWRGCAALFSKEVSLETETTYVGVWCGSRMGRLSKRNMVRAHRACGCLRPSPRATEGIDHRPMSKSGFDDRALSPQPPVTRHASQAVNPRPLLHFPFLPPGLLASGITSRAASRSKRDDDAADVGAARSINSTAGALPLGPDLDGLAFSGGLHIFRAADPSPETMVVFQAVEPR